MQTNREKCKEKIKKFIDDLDDIQLYELLLSDAGVPEVYSCSACMQEFGDTQCDDPGICEKRFFNWINMTGGTT